MATFNIPDIPDDLTRDPSSYGGRRKDRDKGKGKGGKPKPSKPPVDEEQRNEELYDALLRKFEKLNLGSLAPLIMDLVVQGYNAADISTMLQDTDEYKARFAGNEQIKRRIKNGEVGLRVLTPREYIEQETQYRDVLSYYGLPPGFYDDPTDFAGWIGKGVSVLEVQDRARMAKEKVNNSTQEFKDALRQYYGVTEGDLAAFFLDQERALPILERRAAAAELGGAAGAQGLDVARARAEELASYVSSTEQARQGYAAIADALPGADKLADIDKVEYGLSDLEDEVFKGDAGAAKKRRDLADREKARFNKSSGTNQYSFSQDTGSF